MNQLNRTLIDIEITKGQISACTRWMTDTQTRLLVAPEVQVTSIREHVDCLAQDLRELELQLELLELRKERLEAVTDFDVEQIERIVKEEPTNQPITSSRAFLLMNAMRRKVEDACINRIATDLYRYHTYKIHIEDEGDLVLTVKYDKFNMIAGGTVTWSKRRWIKPAEALDPKDKWGWYRELRAIADDMALDGDQIHANIKEQHGLESMKDALLEQVRDAALTYRAARRLAERCDELWAGSGTQIIEALARNNKVELTALGALSARQFEITPHISWIEHMLISQVAA